MDILSKRQLYHCWYSMKKRCNNPSCISFKHYGKRGIAYDLKWEKFDGFLKDMLSSYPGYSKRMSIDRINVDGDYYKENCRWIPMNKNRPRTDIYITYKGEKHTIAAWERKLRIKNGTLQARIRKGMSKIKAIETPVRKIGILFNGKLLSLKEISKLTRVYVDTIGKRLKNGISIEEATDINYGNRTRREFAKNRPRLANGRWQR